MGRYVVDSRLNHDQVDYEVGEVVELTDEQAAALPAGRVHPEEPAEAESIAPRTRTRKGQ